jgi:hypothetical protein
MRGAENRDPSIPPGLDHPHNRAVLAHVAPLSAHSDIADVLRAAVKPLGDVRLFCPDWQSDRAAVASTKGIVFGLAVGMDTVAFRLDPRMKTRALQTGGLAYPDCGDDWVAVLHHRPDSEWPAVDVRFWARKAYVHAREL